MGGKGQDAVNGNREHSNCPEGKKTLDGTGFTEGGYLHPNNILA